MEAKERIIKVLYFINLLYKKSKWKIKFSLTPSR